MICPMASHCIYITYFSYRLEQLQKKKICFHLSNQFHQSTQSTLQVLPSGNWESYLHFRVTGEEAWRDKGPGRSRKWSVLPSRVGLCNMWPFLKFKVSQRVSRARG